MKIIVILITSLSISALCNAQVEQAIIIDGQEQMITGVNLQNDGYSIFSYGVSYGTNYLVKYDNANNVQFIKMALDTTGDLQFHSLTDAGLNNYYLVFCINNEDPLGTNVYTIQKIDQSGNMVWEKSLQSTGWIYWKAVLKNDAVGNIYLLSSVYDAIDIYKLSSEGDLLWSKTIIPDTLSGKNPGFDIQITANGDIVCSGKAESDIFLVRLSDDGQMLWSKRFNDFGTRYSRAYKVLELPNGNLLSFGLRTDLVDNYGFFLLEMDENGNIIKFNEYLSFLSDSLTPAFIPYELYLSPNGAKILFGVGYNYSGGYSFPEFPMIVELDQNDDIVTAKRVNGLLSGGYSSVSPFDLSGDKIVYFRDDGRYYFAAGTINILPVCGLEIVPFPVKQAVNINSSNISSRTKIIDGLGLIEGSVILGNLTSITYKTGCTSFTSIPETTQDDLQLYPNPTAGKLNLNFIQLISGTAYIYDMSGKLAFEQIVSGQDIALEAGSLSAGMYLLEIKEHSGKTTRMKFVKE